MVPPLRKKNANKYLNPFLREENQKLSANYRKVTNITSQWERRIKVPISRVRIRPEY